MGDPIDELRHAADHAERFDRTRGEEGRVLVTRVSRVRAALDEIAALRARVAELEAAVRAKSAVDLGFAEHKGAEMMRWQAAVFLRERAEGAHDRGSSAEDELRIAAALLGTMPLTDDAREDGDPMLCPGCHAAPNEAHPPYCPDAAIERERAQDVLDDCERDCVRQGGPLECECVFDDAREDGCSDGE